MERMNANLKSGLLLSDLIGAHYSGDFVTEVQNVSATSPTLSRGSVVCRKADGTVCLAGSEGTGPDDVFGVVLDFIVGEQSDGTITASVARNGVLMAPALNLEAGEDLRDYEMPLREIGIHLEQLELVGLVTPIARGAVVPAEQQMPGGAVGLP